MSYAKKLFQGSSFVFMMHVVGGIIAYATRLFFARSLSISDFGLLYAVLAFVGFFTIFRDVGLGPTLTRFIAEFNAKNDRRSMKTFLQITVIYELAFGLIIFSLIFLMSDWLSLHFFKAQASWLLTVIAGSFALSGLFVMQFMLQGMEKIKKYAIIEPMRSGLTLAVSAVFIGMGAIGVAYGYFLAALTVPFAIFYLILREFPYTSVKSMLSFRSLRKSVKLLVHNDLLPFGFMIFIAGLGGTILSYADTLAITYFLSLKDVGLYQAALPTSQLLWILASSVTVVLLPLAASLWAKGDKKTLSMMTSFILKISFVVLIPFVIIIMAFPDLVIRLLFGEPYVAAAPALQVLIVTSLFYMLFATATTILLSIGRARVYMWLYLLISALDLVLNIAFVPALGIVGAAISTLAAYFSGSLISIKFLRANVKFNFQWFDMTKAFVGGVLTLCVVLLLKNSINANPWIEIAVSIVVALLFYSAYLVLTKTVKKDEIDMIERAGVRLPKSLAKIISRALR